MKLNARYNYETVVLKKEDKGTYTLQQKMSRS